MHVNTRQKCLCSTRADSAASRLCRFSLLSTSHGTLVRVWQEKVSKISPGCPKEGIASQIRCSLVLNTNNVTRHVTIPKRCDRQQSRLDLEAVFEISGSQVLCLFLKGALVDSHPARNTEWISLHHTEHINRLRAMGQMAKKTLKRRLLRIEEGMGASPRRP